MIVLSDGDKNEVQYLIDNAPDIIRANIDSGDIAQSIAWQIVIDDAQIVLDDGFCVDEMLVWRLCECSRYMKVKKEAA